MGVQLRVRREEICRARAAVVASKTMANELASCGCSCGRAEESRKAPPGPSKRRWLMLFLSVCARVE